MSHIHSSKCVPLSARCNCFIYDIVVFSNKKQLEAELIVYKDGASMSRMIYHIKMRSEINFETKNLSLNSILLYIESLFKISSSI